MPVEALICLYGVGFVVILIAVMIGINLFHRINPDREEINICPYCERNNKVKILEDEGRIFCECFNCGCRGAWAYSQKIAVFNWNKLTGGD